MLDPNGLKTDLYELTMAAGYYANKVDLRATFELFCHKPHPNRSFFIACGLEQAVDYILNLKFSDEDINFLRALTVFKSTDRFFFDCLKDFKFTGNLWAMREGEIFFAKEPIIQIEAPIVEAQILETYLLSMMHIQSLVATKASRVVGAASSDGIKRGVIDFGSRRAHGPEAAQLAARAAYIGGCIGTSNTSAAKRFNIPVYGTMAHSWVQAFDKEGDAFLKYYDAFPDSTVLLIDTYDTIKAAELAAGLKKNIKGVRLDSGDLAKLSKEVRKILDRAGMKGVKIIASGNLNEYKIQELVAKKAPIDIFGVGTDMVVSKDMPSLDLVYKLVQVEDKNGAVRFRAKTSQGKETVPGRKQVYRFYTKDGKFSKDVTCLFSERPPRPACLPTLSARQARRWQGGQPLLESIIENGKLVKPLADIEGIRRYADKRKGQLPSYCLKLRDGRYLENEIKIKKGLSRS